jgi:hypothetical protein
MHKLATRDMLHRIHGSVSTTVKASSMRTRASSARTLLIITKGTQHPHSNAQARDMLHSIHDSLSKTHDGQRVIHDPCAPEHHPQGRFLESKQESNTLTLMHKLATCYIASMRTVFKRAQLTHVKISVCSESCSPRTLPIRSVPLGERSRSTCIGLYMETLVQATLAL